MFPTCIIIKGIIKRLTMGMSHYWARVIMIMPVTDLNSGIILCSTSLPHTGARLDTRSVVPYRDNIEQF